MNAKNKLLGPVMLVAAAMIWGLSFVAQNEGMNHVEGFTFNGIRMMIGSAVLLPLILFRNKKNNKKLSRDEKRSVLKANIIGIIPVGICLFLGSTLQQFAFNYTETGKIGFLTALYMIFVPILGLFLKKKPTVTIWIGVILGVIGMYLLCVGSSTSFNIGTGELLAIGCALAYAVHILAIDKFGQNIDSIVLSCGQFFVTGFISCILMFIFEKPSLESILNAAIPILYSGVLSSGVGFTVQIVGQKYTDPTIAAMLMCLESVFAVLFAFIMPPHETLQSVEYIGCAVIFIAIIIAQINPKSDKHTQLT
ncbi:MAG: DMT family transporter [Acutalibacteraceae bacterium]|nr:DMT family transporter [Acutalibacteraceae bacterium]